MIRLNGVSLTFPDGDNRLTAVDDVDLHVERGSVAGITGPSGSGKSSLLALAATLITPASGEVIIDDINTTTMSNREKAAIRRRKLGIIFQQSNLLPSLTAKDQLIVMSELLGDRRRSQGRAAAASHALELLDEVGLANHASKRPAQLSGGQRQRVNIARGLMNNPSVLVIDEPTSSLDQERGARIIDLICRVTKEHDTATVIATHDPGVCTQIESVYTMVDGVLTNAVGDASSRRTWAL